MSYYGNMLLVAIEKGDTASEAMKTLENVDQQNKKAESAKAAQQGVQADMACSCSSPDIFFDERNFRCFCRFCNKPPRR